MYAVDINNILGPDLKGGSLKDLISNTTDLQPHHNTKEGHSQMQISHGTSMNRYPDEYLFVKNYVDSKWNTTFGDLKLLSFGSSTGEEAISLATLYFNDTKYQHVSIYGVDIDENTLDSARSKVNKLGSQSQRNVTFFHGEKTHLSVHGKYDVIFANSVLCFYNGRKPLGQVLAHFPFSQYKKSLESLDAVLKDGGLLAIVNMNYNFEETELVERYLPVAKCTENSFVPRIDRDTNEWVEITGQSMDCVWVKMR